MAGRSNPARVVRVKEVALLRRPLTTVLTVAVVTMMIVVAMAMTLFADGTKERLRMNEEVLIVEEIRERYLDTRGPGLH